MRVTMAAFRLKREWLIVGLVAVLAAGVYGYRVVPARRPDVGARFVPGPVIPTVGGTVGFRDGADGVTVAVDVRGLPPYTPGPPPTGPHGFHIHEGSDCEIGDPTNPFQGAGGHWNPDGQPHGNHAGDFPVLFSKGGRARMTFTTNRFAVDDIVGKTVIVHLNPDDYRSQPAGDSGLRIACGVIEDYRR